MRVDQNCRNFFKELSDRYSKGLVKIESYSDLDLLIPKEYRQRTPMSQLLGYYHSIGVRLFIYRNNENINVNAQVYFSKFLFSLHDGKSIDQNYGGSTIEVLLRLLLISDLEEGKDAFDDVFPYILKHGGFSNIVWSQHLKRAVTDLFVWRSFDSEVFDIEVNDPPKYFYYIYELLVKNGFTLDIGLIDIYKKSLFLKKRSSFLEHCS